MDERLFDKEERAKTQAIVLELMPAIVKLSSLLGPSAVMAALESMRITFEVSLYNSMRNNPEKAEELYRKAQEAIAYGRNHTIDSLRKSNVRTSPPKPFEPFTPLVPLRRMTEPEGAEDGAPETEDQEDSAVH